MQHATVKIKKLNPDATLPKYGTPYSAGADLYACEGRAIEIAPHESVFIHTGVAVELPEGTVGLVYARSGLACKRGIAPSNKVGVIDSDYRGEIIVSLHNHSDISVTIADKERIAQLVVTPYIVADFEETDELSESVRGSGGFGSTGKI